MRINSRTRRDHRSSRISAGVSLGTGLSSGRRTAVSTVGIPWGSWVQLQSQIASNRTTVQVTGLPAPTMNCITGLCLRVIMFPSNKVRVL
jgi:hypothetical protein